MRCVLVTGTSTGVGKTITTAALASAAVRRGQRVAIAKPIQTGVPGDEPSDADTIRRLSGCDDVTELAALPDPLAPDTAARLRGLSTPDVAELARRCAEAGRHAEVLFVEGSGGILVRLDLAGGTFLDLGTHLVAAGHDVSFIVVTSLALGTLNHTELTVMAIRQGLHHSDGLVVGSLPATLGLAERCNLDELPRLTGQPILGAIPAGTGDLAPAEFQSQSTRWLSGRPQVEDRPATS